MADAQVKYVNKVGNDHGKITHLGGDKWTWSRDQVIASIEQKTNTFYTLDRGVRAEVLVVNGPYGKYLRTYANGKPTDNLLSLPPCPIAA
jgi:hypothetical protein